ncbi:hypothetical protein F2Q69_00038326 [Brassica cretica]|uniref:MORF/ORRM1/DAG-like MORF domain-containing protein n=1 Tax=Brassica cretica TaxID=69181 RepID=A0A8S9SM84_BRACR|nr:hypothetical protein F2Q69_00038326 [Brassica cretica]
MATRSISRSIPRLLTRSFASSAPLSKTPVAPSLLSRSRPLSVAALSSVLRGGFVSVKGLSSQATASSLKDPSPNWSNRPPKETILLDGCDFEHWLVVVDPPQGDLTRDEIIDGYIKTLAQIVGSEEEARMKIYSVSHRCYFAFGALVSEDLSHKLKELPNVRWVLPDSYLDVRNKDYGGEPFIDGRAVPYDHKYHEEWIRNNDRANDKNKRNDRPRNFDKRRRDNMSGGFPPQPPPMGGPCYQPQQNPPPGFNNKGHHSSQQQANRSTSTPQVSSNDALLKQILESQTRSEKHVGYELKNLHLKIDGSYNELNNKFRTLENQFAAMNTQQNRQQGSLPGKSEQNPKETMKAITLRSGKELPQKALTKDAEKQETPPVVHEVEGLEGQEELCFINNNGSCLRTTSKTAISLNKTLLLVSTTKDTIFPNNKLILLPLLLKSAALMPY